MEEIGTIISSDKPSSPYAADDKVIITVAIRYPKERYAPGDTLVIVNTASGGIHITGKMDEVGLFSDVPG